MTARDVLHTAMGSLFVLTFVALVWTRLLHDEYLRAWIHTLDWQACGWALLSFACATFVFHAWLSHLVLGAVAVAVVALWAGRGQAHLAQVEATSAWVWGRLFPQ